MKFFHLFLFFILILLVGGLGTLYWLDSVQDAVLSVATVDEKTILSEPVEEQIKQLDPGSYFVFQKAVVKDPRLSDWANDDVQEYTFYRVKVGETELVPFATIEHGPEFSGSLIAYPFGQEILMHRYQTDAEYDPQTGSPTEGEEQDGILSLTSEVQVRLQQWGTIRSKNGRYEVVYDSLYDQKESKMVVVTDLLTNKVVTQFPLSLLKTNTTIQNEPVPFLIDDTASFLYVNDVCGCDGYFSGLVEVDLHSLQVRSLDTLIDSYTWNDVVIDPTMRRLVAIINNDRRSNAEDMGLGETPVPPTTIRVLDLNAPTQGAVIPFKDILIDTQRVFERLLLDPSGADRYLVRELDEEGKIFLVDFSNTEITEDQLLTTGWVLDWAGDWLVVQHPLGSSMSLFNIETKQSVEIDHAENEQLEYVGSVVID